MKDFCAGTCFASKAFSLLDQHRRFKGCNMDCDLLEPAEEDTVLGFTSQVLST